MKFTFDRLILDLCGGSGSWSAPYREAGYDVRIVTIPGEDVRDYRYPGEVHGILAAPPCTTFSYARNRYPATDDEFRIALSVVDACLRIITVSSPTWWALENPVNLLRRWLGKPKLTFNQWEFGDEAHKPTGLWGNFSSPIKKPGPRTKPSTFGTNKPNAQPEDAKTPPGFARAFFEANP